MDFVKKVFLYIAVFANPIDSEAAGSENVSAPASFDQQDKDKSDEDDEKASGKNCSSLQSSDAESDSESDKDNGTLTSHSTINEISSPQFSKASGITIKGSPQPQQTRIVEGFIDAKRGNGNDQPLSHSEEWQKTSRIKRGWVFTSTENELIRPRISIPRLQETEFDVEKQKPPDSHHARSLFSAFQTGRPVPASHVSVDQVPSFPVRNDHSVTFMSVQSQATEQVPTEKIQQPIFYREAPEKLRGPDEDIVKFIQGLVQKEISDGSRLNLFDAAVLYDKRDYHEAFEFKEQIKDMVKRGLGEELKIEMFDSEEFHQSHVLVVEDIVQRCSVVLVYLTKNANSDKFNFFYEEAIGLTRLCVDKTRQDNAKRFILKPVHTLPEWKRNYTTPVGLLTTRGIEWYDKFSSHTRAKILEIMKTAIANRKSHGVKQNDRETHVQNHNDVYTAKPTAHTIGGDNHQMRSGPVYPPSVHGDSFNRHNMQEFSPKPTVPISHPVYMRKPVFTENSAIQRPDCNDSRHRLSAEEWQTSYSGLSFVSESVPSGERHFQPFNGELERPHAPLVVAEPTGLLDTPVTNQSYYPYQYGHAQPQLLCQNEDHSKQITSPIQSQHRPKEIPRLSTSNQHEYSGMQLYQINPHYEGRTSGLEPHSASTKYTQPYWQSQNRTETLERERYRIPERQLYNEARSDRFHESHFTGQGSVGGPSGQTYFTAPDIQTNQAAVQNTLHGNIYQNTGSVTGSYTAVLLPTNPETNRHTSEEFVSSSNNVMSRDAARSLRTCTSLDEHNTPLSSDLSVISRLTGKLIINPNLSTDDLEIDSEEPELRILHKQRKPPRSGLHQNLVTKRKPQASNTNRSEMIQETTDKIFTSKKDFIRSTNGTSKRKPKAHMVNIVGGHVVQIGRGNSLLTQRKPKTETENTKSRSNLDRRHCPATREQKPDTDGIVSVPHSSIHDNTLESQEKPNREKNLSELIVDDGASSTNDFDRSLPAKRSTNKSEKDQANMKYWQSMNDFDSESTFKNLKTMTNLSSSDKSKGSVKTPLTDGSKELQIFRPNSDSLCSKQSNSTPSQDPAFEDLPSGKNIDNSRNEGKLVTGLDTGPSTTQASSSSWLKEMFESFFKATKKPLETEIY